MPAPPTRRRQQRLATPPKPPHGQPRAQARASSSFASGNTTALRTTTPGGFTATPAKARSASSTSAGAEPGAADTDPAAQGASFASYVFKYVTKACSVSVQPLVKPDSESTPESVPAEVSEPDTDADAKALPPSEPAQDTLIDSGPAARVRAHLDPSIVALASICQRAKGEGFVDFLRSLGGLSIASVPPTYRVKPMRASVTTQYGGQAQRLVGVQVHEIARGQTASVLVRPLGRQLLPAAAAEAIAQAVDARALAPQEIVWPAHEPEQEPAHEPAHESGSGAASAAGAAGADGAAGAIISGLGALG